MKGISLSQQYKVVPLFYPASGDGSCDIFSMADYSHASIIVLQGTATSASTITVKRCTTAAGGTTSAIEFNYAEETTSGYDILGSLTAATSAGVSLSTGNKQFKVIEVDASQLSSAAKYVQVAFATPSKSNLAVVAVLSGSRFAEDAQRTALT